MGHDPAMITRDKSKSPAEDAAVHKKKKTGRKAYTVECRYVGPIPERYDFMASYRKWHRWSKYKTKQSRDEALIALQKKAENCYMKAADKSYRWFAYEFRAGE